MSKVNVWLRSKQQIILVVICCVCMVTFVIGGSIFYMFESGPTADGRIFGRKVSGAEVHRLARLLSVFVGGRGEVTEEQLLGHAWETLIYAEEAKRCGIAPTDADVARAVAQNFPGPAGGVDGPTYERYLAMRGITRADYEDTIRALLTGAKLQQAVGASVTLPESEAWLWYSREKQKVKARYLMLAAADLAPLVKVEEAELKRFYNEHRNTPRGNGEYGAGYQEPEKVKVEYVLASYSKFADTATVTPEQIAAYYEEHKQEYLVKPKAEAEKAGEKDKEKEKEAKAEYKPLAEVSPEIAKTLRDKAAREAATAAMRKVNERIAKAYEALPFESEEEPKIDLAAIARDIGLDHVQTDLLSAEELEKILPGAADLREKAFNQGANRIGRLSARMEARDGQFIFRLTEIKYAEPAPFESVRAEAEKHYRMKKAAEMAQEIAGKALAAAGKGPAKKDDDAPASTESLDAATRAVEEVLAGLIKDAGDAPSEKDPGKLFTAGESQLFGRPQETRMWGGAYRFHFGAGLPGGYDTANFADAAFALKEGEVGMASDQADAPRAFFLLQRTESVLPSREDYEKEKDRVTPSLLAEKRMAFMESWARDLRRRAAPSPEAMQYLRRLPDWES